MKFIGLPKNTGNSGRSRFSTFVGIGIIVLLAFSCVVGTDTLLSGSRSKKNKEYDQVNNIEYKAGSTELETTATVAETAVADKKVAEDEPSLADADRDSFKSSKTGSKLETGADTGAAGAVGATDATTTTSSESSEETSEATTSSETTVPETTSEPTPEPTEKPEPTNTPTPKSTPTPKPAWTESPMSGTFYVNGEVNVRSGPGTDYPITKTLHAGDAIEVVAITNTGWYRTIRDTYVLADLCSDEKPATPTPTPRPEPTNTPVPKPEPDRDPTPVPTPTPTPVPETKPEPTPEPTEPEKPSNPEKGSMRLVGADFKVTFYGPDYAGPGTDNRTTRTGTICTEGRTIAVDPNVIPLGSTVYVENDPLGGDGYYIAEDTGYGVDGHTIDIFAEDGESGNHPTLYDVKVYIVY